MTRRIEAMEKEMEELEEIARLERFP